jgi:hypothetical protein
MLLEENLDPGKISAGLANASAWDENDAFSLITAPRLHL